MRILPDHPSIEFLKREAKDVLAALRERQPAATLAVAQRTLARQYGFPSWAALKADVERRRTEVPAAEPALAAAVAAAFGLGDVHSMIPLSYEPTGRRWKLSTSRGRFRAGPFYPWLGEAQAQLGVELAEAARGAGIAVPEPVRSAGGRLVEEVDGAPWRVDRWIELGPTPMTPVRTSVARRVGEIVGTLHALAIPSDRAVSPYLTWRRPMGEWEALLDRARAAGRAWAPRLDALLPRIAELDAVRADIDPAQVVLTNCNLVPESVRLTKGGDLVVVEWNFSGSLTPELDLASVLVQWAAQPSIDVAVTAAVLEGYAAAAGRVPALRPESFAVAATGWLNWTYARLCDAVGDESSTTDAEGFAFSEQEALDLLDDPMTVEKIGRLLAAAGAAAAPVSA